MPISGDALQWWIQHPELADTRRLIAELQRLREESHGQREELARFIISHYSGPGCAICGRTRSEHAVVALQSIHDALRASHAELLEALVEEHGIPCVLDGKPIECWVCEAIARARELTGKE